VFSGLCAGLLGGYERTFEIDAEGFGEAGSLVVRDELPGVS
jgi:hypothetical protein